MKPKMKRHGVQYMAVCWYERRRSPEEKVRRAIAHLTQVREELMCDDVRDFFDGSYTDADKSCLVASNAGWLRLTLQIHLRKRGLQEKLKIETLDARYWYRP